MVSRAVSHSNTTTGNCWNAGLCHNYGETCFVRYKTSSAGFAQCKKTCPAGWLCETRTPDGCGPSPLPKRIQPAPDGVRELASAAPFLRLCDRRNPPTGAPVFELTCYDGGQTGNRFLMVRALMARAACCSGVALLPPEFDHLADTGASCLDFSQRPRPEGPPHKGCAPEGYVSLRPSELESNLSRSLG